VFHWAWVIEALKMVKPNTKIQPMDFDGVVERGNNFLVFETKEVGKKISKAQQWTLERLIKAKSFCIMKVWGKTIPESYEIEFYSKGILQYRRIDKGLESARDYVAQWFRWADTQAS
jgi:hypothetical protein